MGAVTAFITSTGTGAGKTFVTRGLARALADRGSSVAALKPIETGCNPDPLDALALAAACRGPELAHHPAFYRAVAALSPYAVSLQSGLPEPDLDALAATIEALARLHAFTLVEGAGGLLVPVDARQTLADLARRLGAPLILVAPNQLGVLSHLLTAHESAQARGLTILATVLTHLTPTPDPSAPTNLQILSARLPCPVIPFPFTENNDNALAATATNSGLLDLLPP